MRLKEFPGRWLAKVAFLLFVSDALADVVLNAEDTNASVIIMERGLGNLEELKKNYKVSLYLSSACMFLTRPVVVSLQPQAMSSAADIRANIIDQMARCVASLHKRKESVRCSLPTITAALLTVFSFVLGHLGRSQTRELPGVHHWRCDHDQNGDNTSLSTELSIRVWFRRLISTALCCSASHCKRALRSICRRSSLRARTTRRLPRKLPPNTTVSRHSCHSLCWIKQL
jgi:hypothetical protein